MNYHSQKSTQGRLLYLECGITVRSNVNTGIQRVVRNIIREADVVGPEFELTPVQVAFSGNYFYPVENNIQQTSKKNAIEVLPDTRWVKFIRAVDNKIKKKFTFRLYQTLRHHVREMVLGRKVPLIQKEIELLPVGPNGSSSVLLLLDSNWNNAIWPLVDAFRDNGGTVCAVLYDLIPFLHPETVAEQTRNAHTTWWREAPRHLDSVICISKSVRDEFLDWQVREKISLPLTKEKIGYFYLGAELSKTDLVIRLLTERVQYFLMVGSLEPRKNHKTVLNAFEKLWSQGENVRLVIVGAFGWKNDEIINRIENHPQLNRLLFLIRDASDRDLVALYRSAGGVICASLAEGYGLPIVEAKQHGVSVVCSDIPVFREVAGLSCCYFPPIDYVSLAECVGDVFRSLKKDRVNNEIATTEFISWTESCRQLFGSIPNE